MTIIRPAIAQDVVQLLPLVVQLGYPLSLDSLQERLSHYINQESYRVYIAEIDDNIVGVIAIVFHEFFVIQGRKATIEALVVDENYRGCSIGTQLVKAAETYAKQNNCLVIDLLSGLRRAEDGTHEFYKKLGYHNEGYMAKLYLRKEL